MSIKSDAFLADWLSHRGVTTHAPAAGATVVFSVSPANAHERIVLDTLSYTIKNMSGAAFTVTTSIRDASIAGTVLASWDEIVAASASGGKHLEFGAGFPGVKGNAMVITQDTVLASVKATVNATYWKAQSTDY